jgi:hypothetical protein
LKTWQVKAILPDGAGGMAVLFDCCVGVSTACGVIRAGIRGVRVFVTEGEPGKTSGGLELSGENPAERLTLRTKSAIIADMVRQARDPMITKK